MQCEAIFQKFKTTYHHCQIFLLLRQNLAKRDVQVGARLALSIMDKSQSQWNIKKVIFTQRHFIKDQIFLKDNENFSVHRWRCFHMTYLLIIKQSFTQNFWQIILNPIICDLKSHIMPQLNVFWKFVHAAIKKKRV